MGIYLTYYTNLSNRGFSVRFKSKKEKKNVIIINNKIIIVVQISKKHTSVTLNLKK